MLKCMLTAMVIVGILAANPGMPLGDSALHKKYRVEFAVPDLPAFKVLGSTPDEILRPSTPELVSIVASTLAHGGVLPEDLALEVAPLVMFKANRLTLSDYQRNRLLYSLRLSVGTTNELSDSGAVTRLAGVGARVTLFDGGDLRTRRDYLDTVDMVLHELVAWADSIETELMMEYGWDDDTLHADPDLSTRLDYLVTQETERYEKQLGATFDQRLRDIKQDFKARNWNKAKLDLAAAGLFAQNPSGNRVTATRASCWLTGAVPLGGWGQGLLGASASWYPDEMAGEDWSAIAGLRFYGGINRLKAMVECQYEYLATGNLLVNCGAEVNVWNGIWFTLAAGMEWEDFTANGPAYLVSDFDVRFTLPEQFALF